MFIEVVFFFGLVFNYLLEEFGERIGVGLRNLTHFGAGRTQVTQIDVNRQVAEFAELNKRHRED